MDKPTDDQERMEQFYRLLSDYGLRGRSQPLTRQKQSEINALFPDEEE
jgi:hypothetical protein